jgi:TolB protein
MLRGSLLAAALLPLLGFGSGAGHVRNGRIAYEHVGDGRGFQIYTTTPTGTQRRHLTSGHTYSSYDPSYAPRGKRLVFVRASKRQRDLWTMNSDGSHKRDLTSTSQVDEIDPAWSPSGEQIAFAVGSPGALQGIWVVGADGAGSRRITAGDDSQPSWSPDGNEIAFQRHDAATQGDAIFVVPAAGGSPTNLTSNPAVADLQPAWSPDGSRILFSSVPSDGFQLDLWVMNADGTGRRQLTKTPFRDEHDPAWAPDGRKIVYVGESSSHGASSYQLYVSNANGSNRRIITNACGECAYINDDPSWQPLP